MMNVLRPRPIQGVYEKPFWESVQQRVLKLQACCNCGALRYPPGPICHKCQSPEFTWNEVSGRGRLVSWTVFHRQYFPEFPAPYTVVSAVLEEGPILIANLVGGEPVSLRIDMPLKLTYENARSKDGEWIIYQWSAIGDGTS